MGATAVEEVAPPPPPPFNPAEQLGAMAPLGYFDPLGFAKVGDEQGFRKLRAAELKHGRVAMMASIGAVGQHFIKFPWATQVKGTFGAMGSGAGVVGFLALFCVSGVLELAWREDASREPGNFGDPMGLNMYTDDMRSKELNNGRMAMISVLGIFAAEMMTGQDAIEQFGLSAVSDRAGRQHSSRSSFVGSASVGQKAARGRVSAMATAEEAAPPPFNPAEQVGAMAPLGYFDPLNFAKVGDEAGFRQLRAAELKHGRVAMMASIGALGQHFVKFPFAESARGTFGAVFSPEAQLGLPLLLLVAAGLEGAWREDASREPGNFGDPMGLNMYTDDMR